MVSTRTYRKYNSSYWTGKTVRTTRILRNGNIEIPAGTICQILGKSGGFTLKTEPCRCCGVSVFIRKVGPEAVDLVTVPEDAVPKETEN